MSYDPGARRRADGEPMTMWSDVTAGRGVGRRVLTQSVVDHFHPLTEHLERESAEYGLSIRITPQPLAGLVVVEWWPSATPTLELDFEQAIQDARAVDAAA